MPCLARLAHEHSHPLPCVTGPCTGGVILALIEGIGIALTRAQSKQYKPGEKYAEMYGTLGSESNY